MDASPRGGDGSGTDSACAETSVSSTSSSEDEAGCLELFILQVSPPALFSSSTFSCAASSSCTIFPRLTLVPLIEASFQAAASRTVQPPTILGYPLLPYSPSFYYTAPISFGLIIEAKKKPNQAALLAAVPKSQATAKKSFEDVEEALHAGWGQEWNYLASGNWMEGLADSIVMHVTVEENGSSSDEQQEEEVEDQEEVEGNPTGFLSEEGAEVIEAGNGHTSDRRVTENESSSFLKELICPICLDVFNLPVTVSCGHTFCRYCISHSKLAGKTCPLCRQPVGPALSVNLALTGVIRSSGVKRRTPQITSLPSQPSTRLNTVDDNWWQENFIKPQVSVSLFLRIFLDDMSLSAVLFDDLTACVIDYFTKNNKWSRGKWVFTLHDCELFSSIVSYDIDDLAGSEERLHHWVERYIADSPSVCPPREPLNVTLKIFADRLHRIEAQTFESSSIPHRLPWDGGRHIKSLIQLPHSSVSLSHLLFMRSPGGELGVVDCGSTIGTMIRVQNEHELFNGDIVHIGDRLEVQIIITNGAAGSPYKGYMWCSKKMEVLDYTQVKSRSGSMSGDACCQPREQSIEYTGHGPASREGSPDTNTESDLAFRSDGERCRQASNVGAANRSRSEDIGESTPHVTEQQREDLRWERRTHHNSMARTIVHASEAAVSAAAQAAAEMQQRGMRPQMTFLESDDVPDELELEESLPALDIEDPCTSKPSDDISEEEVGSRQDQDLEFEPLESHMRIRVMGSSQCEIDEWIDPKGIILGRGPHSQSLYKKISVTSVNGYVSREHCLVYYDGTKPPGRRWNLRDISTLGTFLKVKPFSDPVPLASGALFKAGQCKIEVGPCDTAHGLRRSSNYPPLVGAPSPQISAAYAATPTSPRQPNGQYRFRPVRAPTGELVVGGMPIALDPSANAATQLPPMQNEALIRNGPSSVPQMLNQLLNNLVQLGRQDEGSLPPLPPGNGSPAGSLGPLRAAVRPSPLFVQQHLARSASPPLGHSDRHEGIVVPTSDVQTTGNVPNIAIPQMNPLHPSLWNTCPTRSPFVQQAPANAESPFETPPRRAPLYPPGSMQPLDYQAGMPSLYSNMRQFPPHLLHPALQVAFLQDPNHMMQGGPMDARQQQQQTHDARLHQDVRMHDDMAGTFQDADATDDGTN